MADTSIRVIARFRPISEREKKEIVEGKDGIALEFRDEHTVQVNQGQGKEPMIWTFDRVFHGNSSQVEIFQMSAKETVEDTLKGYNGTIFAYGQTGSGKSHTMMGPDIQSVDLAGIIPRACQFIFEHISKNPDHCEFRVTLSFLEIYKEVIKDLLHPTGLNLKVRETPTRGVWVEDLQEIEVKSHTDVMTLLKQGEEHRAVASTNMNAVSSRSHSLFILTVTQKTRDGVTKVGKLNLADLAGSEKVGKTGASGETLEEAKKINQSLSALGNCIMALTKQKKQHVPYRDSKLTFILRESLGGNTKTTLLIACSPHSFNLEETISTLRFGQRAKAIKNKVKINAQRSAAELEIIVAKLTREVKIWKRYSKRLEQELARSIDPVDLEALKRSLLEEAQQSSTKFKTPVKKSDDANGLTPPNENDLNDTSNTIDVKVSTAPTSPRESYQLTRFSLATGLQRSSTVAGLQTPGKSPFRYHDDSELSSPSVDALNTTPSRTALFMDGILADDDPSSLLLDTQLEFNRLKDNFTLQLQDLNEELVQAREEKEVAVKQSGIQISRLTEENSLLRAELDMLKAQLEPQVVNVLTNNTTEPTQSQISITDFKLDIPARSLQKEEKQEFSPRHQLNSSQWARQTFHWMVLAIKLELFSQDIPIQSDVDLEALLSSLQDPAVPIQRWPQRIMATLESITRKS